MSLDAEFEAAADTIKNKNGTWDGSFIRNQNIQNETDTCVDKC